MMPECDAYIPLHSGVGEIALKAGDRELFRKMMEERGTYSQIPLCVFKIDWVYFVGHGGRTHLAPDFLLNENSPRDIEPKISGAIEENRIDSAKVMTELCKIIVRIDLRRVAERHEPERTNKRTTECLPIHLWIRSAMRG